MSKPPENLPLAPAQAQLNISLYVSNISHSQQLNICTYSFVRADTNTTHVNIDTHIYMHTHDTLWWTYVVPVYLWLQLPSHRLSSMLVHKSLSSCSTLKQNKTDFHKFLSRGSGLDWSEETINSDTFTTKLRAYLILYELWQIST